jgi:hypothetical protein
MRCIPNHFQSRNFGYNVMNYQRSIIAPGEAEAVKNNIISFYKAAGYRQTAEEPCLEFQRGSVKGTLLGFTPRSNRCLAKVKLAQGEAGFTEARIEETFNPILWASRDESEFVKNELKDLEASLHQNKISLDITNEMTRAFWREAAALGIWVIFLGLIPAFIGVPIGGVPGFVAGSLVAVVLLALLWGPVKVWNKRKISHILEKGTSAS